MFSGSFSGTFSIDSSNIAWFWIKVFSLSDFSVLLLNRLCLEQNEDDFLEIGSMFMSSLLKNPEVLASSMLRSEDKFEEK